ncbi:MAG: EAL domain-containing protein [Candidatus Thiodiazotropha sp. 'RUGA']|nr:EAL domain-containing protein [Candidatus Thiodiazotropha sp. 'RUGA']
MNKKPSQSQAAMDAEIERSNFFDLSIDLLAVANTEGKFVKVNHAWKELLGWEPEDLLSDTFLSFVHPDDIDATVNQIQSQKESGTTVQQFVNRYRCKDGSYRWLEWTASAEIDGFVYAIARDKTDQKRTEQERDRFFDISIDLLVIANTDGTFRKVNERWTEVLGWEQSELVNRPFFDFVHPDDIAPTLVELEREKRGERVTKFVNRYRCKDNSYLYLEWTTQPEPDGTIYAVARDITQRKLAEQAIMQSVERYQSVIETANDGFWVIDIHGNILEVNDSYCRLSGYSREELLQMHISDIDATKTREDTLTHIKEIVNKKNVLFETRHRHKNGTFWDAEISSSHSNIEGGRFFVFIRDIRERKFNEQIANLRDGLSKIVYQGEMDNIMRVALDIAESITQSQIGFYHFVEKDQKTLSLQVWSSNTLKNMCRSEGEDMHYPIDQAGVWVDCIHQRKPIIHNDYEALDHKKGMPESHPKLVREITVPIFRDSLIVAVAGLGNKEIEYSNWDLNVLERIADVAYDFIERKQSEMQIEHMAYYDALTGLPNRTLFSERMSQAMSQCSHTGLVLAVCYLDLDGFKAVNDEHGHDVGDELLISLAKRMMNILREGDTLARLGGDEFVILLNNLKEGKESESFLSRAIERIEKPFVVKGYRLAISASIGVTIFPEDDSTADTLLRHADQAMYKAKADPDIDYHMYDLIEEQEIRSKRQMLDQFKQALEREELVLHYQPRIDLFSGEVVSLEALIRWQHPDKGLLMPGQFLPNIEGTPEEVQMDEWVVNQALEQLNQWLDHDTAIPLSINISPHHIQQGNFSEYLTDQLTHYPDGIAQNLELEVLETAAIHDIEHVAKMMNSCSKLGVSFSLDDFGTGYSSLTHFHRLPINVLKIDQNFVRSMIDDVNNLDIVKGVVQLSKALQRPVVAEGVENIELGMILLYLGCQYAQGYGIARPMPIEAFDDWMMYWKKERLWHRLHDQEELSSEDIELKIAVYSHRRWLESVEQYIQTNGNSELPSLDSGQSTFSHWYYGMGVARYGNRPAYAFLLPKHLHTHEVAASLIKLVDKGEQKEAKELLGSLATASDSLLDILTNLSAQ